MNRVMRGCVAPLLVVFLAASLSSCYTILKRPEAIDDPEESTYIYRDVIFPPIVPPPPPPPPPPPDQPPEPAPPVRPIDPKPPEKRDAETKEKDPPGKKTIEMESAVTS